MLIIVLAPLLSGLKRYRCYNVIGIDKLNYRFWRIIDIDAISVL